MPRIDLQLANTLMAEHKREFATNVQPVIEAVQEDLRNRGKNHGYDSVARSLNRLKIRPYRGGMWSGATVRRILLRPGQEG